jgi:hypothetical protein
MQEKQGGENHELTPPTMVAESEVQPNPNLDQDLILNPDQTGSSRHLNPDQSGSTNNPKPDQSGSNPNPNPNPNGSAIVTISEIYERSKDQVDVGILLDVECNQFDFAPN